MMARPAAAAAGPLLLRLLLLCSVACCCVRCNYAGPAVQTTTLAPTLRGFVPPFTRPMQAADELPAAPSGNITLYMAPNLGLDGPPSAPAAALRRRTARRTAPRLQAMMRPATTGGTRLGAAGGVAAIVPLRKQQQQAPGAAGRALLGAPRVSSNEFELRQNLPGQGGGFTPELVGAPAAAPAQQLLAGLG
jgi:hypothetical protein